jgi:uncharacterized protein YjbI with pentapeptide repeats
MGGMGWKFNQPHVDLSEADLERACLKSADFIGVNFYNALLGEADVSGTCLVRANLIGADLTSANLSEVRLSETTLVTLI